MHVLVIKLSTMRDVINTLPALADAAEAIRKIKFDWLISEQCSDIAEMNSTIRRVITINTSKINASFAKSLITGEFAQLKRQLQHTKYDLIIDAQGNELSALLTRIANGPSSGYDKQSLRNGLLSKAYDQVQFVNKTQHIVERTRQLFAQSLNYPLIDKAVNYGIAQTNSLLQGKKIKRQKQLMFLTGTDWESKHWPIKNWVDLANMATAKGLKIILPWHTKSDQKLALTIKKACKLSEQVIIPKKMNLTALTQRMASAMAIVSVDSGLSHLAVAMDTPLITLFGPSNPVLQGSQENKAISLSAQYHCSPCEKTTCKYVKNNESPLCYKNLPPQRVQKYLSKILSNHYKGSTALKTVQQANVRRTSQVA